MKKFILVVISFAVLLVSCEMDSSGDIVLKGEQNITEHEKTPVIIAEIESKGKEENKNDLEEKENETEIVEDDEEESDVETDTDLKKENEAVIDVKIEEEAIEIKEEDLQETENISEKSENNEKAEVIEETENIEEENKDNNIETDSNIPNENTISEDIEEEKIEIQKDESEEDKDIRIENENLIKEEEQSNDELNEQKTENNQEESCEEEIEAEPPENLEIQTEEIKEEIQLEEEINPEIIQEEVLKQKFEDIKNPMPPKAWTVMMYLPSGKNKENTSVLNILKETELSEDTNVLIFYDGCICDDLQNDCSTLIRLKADETNAGKSILSPVNAMNQMNYNFGSKETLLMFVEWVKEYFPSENYGMIFYNQAEIDDEALIPAFTLAKDDCSDDFLYVDEAKSALEKIFVQEKLEFTALDMNFAASLEYAAELQNVSKYLGGVEGFARNFSFDYVNWLSSIDDQCEDGKTVLMNLSETYGSIKNRFAVLDLSLTDSLLAKLNEFCIEAQKKIINSTQKQMVTEKYVNKIEARYADFSKSIVEYYNFSDFVRKIRNKYYTILTELDNELQELINQTVCNVEPKPTKSWVFGKIPFSFCYCNINEQNQEINSVPERINNSKLNDMTLEAAKKADSFYAGNQLIPSLLDRLVYENFGGNSNE